MKINLERANAIMKRCIIEADPHHQLVYQQEKEFIIMFCQSQYGKNIPEEVLIAAFILNAQMIQKDYEPEYRLEKMVEFLNHKKNVENEFKYRFK